MENVGVDDWSVDTAWLQHYTRYGQYRYAVAPLHDAASISWLTTAAIYGDYARIRHCLAAGANATERDDHNKTPFQYAIRYLTPEMVYYITCIHEEIVRQLTKCLGRKPTQLEIYGVSTHKKARKFRFHVKQRAATVSGRFMEAVNRGDLETVQSMVERDEIGVNAVNKSTGESALSVALSRKHTRVAMYLLQKGADTYSGTRMNGERCSTLVAAVQSGDVKLVCEVVNCGGLHSSQSHGARCVLFEAAKTGSIQMIETLLELGVHFLYFKDQLPPRYQYIKNAPYSIQTPTPSEKDLWLLLCSACWLHDQQLFNYLRRAHPILQDFAARPAIAAVLLALAVYEDDGELVSELLDSGVDVSVGEAAMVAAVAVDSTRMLRLLLDRGGDVSTRCSGIIQRLYPSLLAIAVNANAMDCVRILLPLETRPAYRDSAIQEAITGGNVEMVDLLIEAYRESSQARGFHFCVLHTTSPLVADLLLTSCWCAGDYPVDAMQQCFQRLFYTKRFPSPALLSFYIAHGIDVTSASVPSDGISSTTSSLMESVLHGFNRLPALPTLNFLLENGVPSLTVSRGKTPEQARDEESQRSSHRNFKRRLFAQCRDLLASHGCVKSTTV